MAVNAWLMPFLKIFGLYKGNSFSPFSVSIGIPNDICKLVKEYSKRPIQDRCGCSAGTVVEDDEEVEVDEVGTTSENPAANTIGIVQNHFKNIKKSDLDPSLDDIEDNGIGGNTVNTNAQQP